MTAPALEPDLGLTDRVLLVTGGGRGLGRAQAVALAAAGARVVVLDNGVAVDGSGGEASVAEETCRLIRGQGGWAHPVSRNTSAFAAGQEVVQELLVRFGRIDGVVHCAGVLRDRPFQDLGQDDWNAMLSCHLGTVVSLTRAVWPHFRERGYGRVVFTTSGSGLWGNPHQTAYAAVKMALVGLMNGLKLETAGSDVRVNALAPAAATRMTEGSMGPRLAERFSPESVAPLAVYLASPRCQESGELFEVGGGVVRLVCLTEAAAPISIKGAGPAAVGQRLAAGLSGAERLRPFPNLQDALLGLMRAAL